MSMLPLNLSTVGAHQYSIRGAGLECFCEALKSLGYDGKYLGYDISDSALIEARRKFSSDKGFKFINHKWTDDVIQDSVDGIYFGGVFYYIDDKKSFLEKHINAYDPKTVIIQDLDSTDLTFLDHIEVKDVHRKDFDIDLNAHGSDSRNRRQVLKIRLK